MTKEELYQDLHSKLYRSMWECVALLDQGRTDELRETMNKRHWISIDFNSSIPIDIEKNIIRHAYNQTAKGLTKKMRSELGFE